MSVKMYPMTGCFCSFVFLSYVVFLSQCLLVYGETIKPDGVGGEGILLF